MPGFGAALFVLPTTFSTNCLSQCAKADASSNLTLQCIMSQNGQTHFKNLAAFAARFLKYV